MRFSFLFGRTFLPSVLALAVVFHPLLAMAERVEEIGAKGAAEPIASPLPEAGDPTADGGVYVVPQLADGNIPGRVRMFDASGNLEPVRATIYFVQNGKVVASARSDEWGRFQVTGLRPGVYSVLAVSRDGFGVLSIVVRPSEASAATEKPSVFQVGLSLQTPPPLDITLIPIAEFDLLAELLAEVIGDSAAGQPVPFGAGIGGGGGGGGGGLGGLLGVAGLAGGIAALATNRTLATQFVP